MAGNSLDLPQDMLMEIFALLDVPDLVRAGAVCSSWRASYISLCNHGGYKQAQTPCLLYTSESTGENVACLYSLVEKREYKLTMPDPPIRSRYIIGSSHGWIITADERSELHLVNPVTGDQISLPTVTTIEQVKPIYDDAGELHEYEYSWYAGHPFKYPSPSIFSLGLLRKYLFRKAFLSCDPSMGDYFVVLIHNPIEQLSFARAGDDKWTWLPPHTDCCDCLFEDGLLYVLNSFGEVHAFDLSGPTVSQKLVVGKVNTYPEENLYFARAPCGDLLQIWRSTTDNFVDCVDQTDEDILQFELDKDGDDLEQEPDREYCRAGDGLKSESDEDDDNSELELNSDSRVQYTNVIQVFKVDFSAKKLVEINNIGDNVLFVGHNQSLCLNANAYPQLKPNHVYFTDDDGLYLFGCKQNRRDIGVLNLEDESIDQIASTELWSNWPAPVWVIPNLRKMISASHI
ncbi:F-box only protein 7-like [Oryza brachyantha]|nr:F-box only protein 7-like [Oryza brachyantha]